MRQAVQARTEQLPDRFLDFQGRRSLETVSANLVRTSAAHSEEQLRMRFFPHRMSFRRIHGPASLSLAQPTASTGNTFLVKWIEHHNRDLSVLAVFSWLGSTPAVAVRGIHDCGIQLPQDLIRKLSQNLASTFRLTLSAWHFFYLRPRCASALRSALS